jgi:alpha-L-rhamnosidase
MNWAIKLLLFPLSATALLAQRPWQQLAVPSLREVAANFKSPPHEYGAIQPFASWNGPDPKEVRARIVRDFDRLAANGIFVVNLSPGRGEPKYLSPEHMDQVKFTVQEAAKRGMRLWIQDESDYPSGFAGGNISRQYPQLGMQGIVADIRVHVVPGQTLTMPAPPDTLAIFATKTSQDQKIEGVIAIPVPANGQLRWIVPAQGSTPNEPRLTWEVVFVRHIYISSPTRNFNREDSTRAKDALYSLIDYLDPEATRAFLKIIHETYRQAVGDQFGKIVLGFFGDEPDYSSSIPWTPRLLDEFQARKGYDLKPYIPSFFVGRGVEPSEETRRARADYYDVWSAIFQNSFFGEQAEWCRKFNVEYLVHLNHEETMIALERSEGDYFRDNRQVQVPGIDNLSQLVPGAIHTPDGAWNVNNNFPKLASSAAHLFGRPKVWSEEGGGIGIDGKFEMDFQLARGVNALEIRVPVLRGGGDPSVAAVPPVIPPQAPMLAWYANRAGYLMAMGRPAAQVGLYHPGNSIWMGDQEADRSTTKLGWQLLENQVDWDYFDEQSLSGVATIANGGFKNLSGQLYRAIVFPSMSVITRTGLERLRAFVKAGGKAIFVGKTPGLIVDKTFMNAKDVPDLSFATLIEPWGDITPRVLAALPKPDVKLDADLPRLTYTHKSWQDAETYFFFNESNKPESRMATVAGRGQAQAWDLATGEIHPISAATAESDAVRFPLVLGPYEAKVVVVGPLPGGVAAAEPSFASGNTVAALDGDWTLELNGKQLTSPLKSWEELGSQSFAGPAAYRKQFTVAVPAGKRVFLEIGDVHDYAKVKLNGNELEAHAWQPYRWDVTSALKTGSNELELEVRATPAGRGGPGGAAAGGRGRGSAPPVSGLLGPVRIVTH